MKMGLLEVMGQPKKVGSWGLSHPFQTCTTGSPNEYSGIEETISPTALTMMSDWILERVGR